MQHDDEVLQFNSVQEFQSRPLFHTALVAAAEDLEKIVGKYLLPEPRMAWICCGLNNCDQPHRRGYIVRLRDGRETNCGHNCGSNHFGVKWEELEAAAAKTETAAATRKSVEAILAQKQALLDRANSLISSCAKFEYKVLMVNALLLQHTTLWRHIKECAKLDGAVRIEVALPSNSINYTYGSKGALKTVATIDGIRLLTEDFIKYSNVISKSVIPELNSWSATELEGKSQKELAAYSQRGQAFIGTLNRAEKQLQTSHLLFRKGNLEKIKLIVQYKMRSREKTSSLLKDVDAVVAIESIVAP
ncbi:hypothetical protein [Azohydromonas lata]|uniref:hypothetical protein n=1 Tax=Azohydromonas lata TaxID=45677 RepID=UPI0012F489B8|nr:hypothetical protein [Azohydromonas lata]